MKTFLTLPICSTDGPVRAGRYVGFAALLALAAFAAFPQVAHAQLFLAQNGQPRCVIVRQAGAAAPERHAADELAATLHQITGAAIPVRDSLPSSPKTAAILVGPGAAASAAFPDIDLTHFGGEELVERVKGNRLLLAGGRPRGTLYAVERFLQDSCGVRWWTPWATDIPHRPTLSVAANLDVRQKPAFEYREPYWHPATDGPWAVHNFGNGNFLKLTAAQLTDDGGKIAYTGGFVHTAYGLVPPSENFGPHPEWYSLIDGKRTADNAQLCLTNQVLRDYVVARVRTILKASPEARILSISQNDDVRFCQCPDCSAVDAREGSHAGTLIDFVNYVADKLGSEFPDVAFDTLAYQYTRHPPKTIRPRPNVIVRLCSVECNFAEPFDHPTNRAFYQDLVDWSKMCDRLYVWDYTTDFGGYVQPYPNWFTLGRNLDLMRQYHVRGVFSEGAYESDGSEMSELRSWVLARLMWDPSLDTGKLIDEFLNGYYGPAAAPFIRRYLETVQAAAKGYYLGCGTPVSAPFLDFKTMSAAESLWQQAEQAAKSDPAKLWRVRESHLPVRYVFLSRWTPLRAEAQKANAPWPLSESRKAVTAEWEQVAFSPGPAGWSPVTNVREGAATARGYMARFDSDPQPPGPPPARKPASGPPADLLATLGSAGVIGAIDIQDDGARLFEEGELSEYRADPLASDGVAVWLPGYHHEWAFQYPYEKFPSAAQDTTRRWKVYLVARVQPGAQAAAHLAAAKGDGGAAFTAGIWDTSVNAPRAGISVSLRDATAQGDGYHSWLLGTMTLTPGEYVWAAPASHPDVDAVWIDRIYLAPAGP